MSRCCLHLVMLMLPLQGAAAPAADLAILVDTGTEMPMARFEQFRLVAGIHRDIGVALARHMQRTPRFLSLPRKRIVRALSDGAADVLCSYVPEWLAARSRQGGRARVADVDRAVGLMITDGTIAAIVAKYR